MCIESSVELSREGRLNLVCAFDTISTQTRGDGEKEKGSIDFGVARPTVTDRVIQKRSEHGKVQGTKMFAFMVAASGLFLQMKQRSDKASDTFDPDAVHATIVSNAQVWGVNQSPSSNLCWTPRGSRDEVSKRCQRRNRGTN